LRLERLRNQNTPPVRRTADQSLPVSDRTGLAVRRIAADLPVTGGF